MRRKLIGLGFEEMRGGLVENEFWLMDALFRPQFHSARDIHDVYYVKQPARAREIEAALSSVSQVDLVLLVVDITQPFGKGDWSSYLPQKGEGNC